MTTVDGTEREPAFAVRTSHCFSLTAQPLIFHRVNPACSKVAISIVCHTRLSQHHCWRELLKPLNTRLEVSVSSCPNRSELIRLQA